MTSLDDLPLDTAPGDATQMAPSAPSSPGPRVAVLVVLGVALVAAGAWYYVAGRARTTAPAAAASAATTAAPVTDTPPVVATLPPLEQMDPYARELLTTLGTSPLLLKYYKGRGHLLVLAKYDRRKSRGTPRPFL